MILLLFAHSDSKKSVILFIISKKNYNFATGIKNKAKTRLQCHAKNNCKEIDSKENSDRFRIKLRI